MSLINIHWDRKSAHPIFAAIFWAAVLTAILSQITFTSYKPFKIDIVQRSVAPVDKLVTVRFQRQFEAPGQVLLLNLKIRNKETGPKSVAVSLNTTHIGDIDLPPGAVKQYFLEVKRENLWVDDNRVEIRAEDDGWELTGFDLKNVYRHSTGIFRFIIIPKATKAVRAPSLLFLLELFFLFFLREIVPSPNKECPPRRRLSPLLVKSFLAFFALFSLLSLVSRYRILFGFDSLVIPTLILCFADPDYVPKFFSFLKRNLSRKELDKSPWKKHLVAISLSALIFLFFYFVMTLSLKQFKGNYSGFVHFGKRLLNDRNPIFWNRSPQLLFTNADFEKGTLENWSARDDVFKIQPTTDGKAAVKLEPWGVNNQGKYWLEINEKYRKENGRVPRESGADQSAETLASPQFIVQKEKVGFLIGRSNPSLETNQYKQSVALEVQGKIVLEEEGTNLKTMELHVWDVRRYIGQPARVIITDIPSQKSDGGRLNLDWFHYYEDARVIKGLLSPNEPGYDGQHFYYMTYDPFLSRFKDNPWKYKLIVDAPPYRYSRIGFSLLIKLFSLDRPKLYPKTMIWLILFSHFFGAFFLLKIVMFYQQSPFWTLLYLLIPGFQLSLQGALPESIAAAFLLAGIYFYLRERLLFASLVLALSFLTRETGAMVAMGIVLFELFKKKNVRNALVIGWSFIPLIFWRFYITLRLFKGFGWRTLFAGPRDFVLPFSGFVRLYKEILAHHYPQDLTLAATIYPLLLTCIFLLSLYFLWKRKDFLSLSLLVFSLVSIVFPYKQVWIHAGNGIRVTYEAVLVSIIVFVSQSGLRKPSVKYLFLSLFLLFFIFFYLLPGVDPFFRKGFVPF